VFQQVQGSNVFIPDKIRGNTNPKNKGTEGGTGNIISKGKQGI